jgi:hypothetical protein
VSVRRFDTNDEHAFRRLDDAQLELVRADMIADGDERLEFVIRVLVLRAVPVIERVCRKRGNDRGLTSTQIQKAIDDASVRMLLRLKRPDRQPAVTAIAAEIATTCVDAQESQLAAAPRLATRRPDLRIADEIGDALKRGRIHPNDWRSS